MDICLIRCPSPFLIDEWVFPPLGLMAIATSLKQSGHNVKICDRENIPMDCDAYGFGPTTPEYSYALYSRELIKKNNPRARTVIGGSYATLNPQKCLNDGFDCVVTGDGELSANVAFTSKSLMIDGGDDHSLDEYPIIDRSVINLDNYKYLLNGINATTLMTSQGCPYKCGFCCKNYKTVRFRSIDNIIKEINMLHFDLGYKALVFPEDLFILKRERVQEIAKYLKLYGIIWRCLVRADLVVKYGDDFLRMLVNSGCVEVGMGVESGSDTILKTINKGETANTIRTAIRMIKTHGIRAKGFFILGLPGESQETLNETWKFLEDVKLDDVDIKIYQPYPGTPIWEHKEKYDIQWDDNIDFDKKFYKGRPKEYYGNVCTSHITNKQLVENWIEMEATYKRA